MRIYWIKAHAPRWLGGMVRIPAWTDPWPAKMSGAAWTVTREWIWPDRVEMAG
jgi:hypothetical protein